MNFCLAIILLYISSALAQKPCSAPIQWEGRLYEYDGSHAFQGAGNFSYDGINKRQRFIEDIKIGRNQNYIDTLVLWNENIQYRYDTQSRTCVKSAVKYPWRDFGVPKNAKFIKSTYVGLKTAGLLVNTWTATFPDDQGNQVEYLGLWTPDACVPITLHYSSYVDSYQVRVDTYDITPGIKDTRIFTPRAECLKL